MLIAPRMMTTSPRLAFHVAPATAEHAAAVRALLPELTSLPTPERAEAAPRCLVARAARDPGLLLGAAAYVPQPHRLRLWGFRGHCHVQPAYRHLGIGRALVRHMAADVADWGVPHLLPWDTVPDGEASLFMQAVGFRNAFSLQHFLAPADTALPFCDGIVQALHRRGRVPPGCTVQALVDVPLAPVLALHCAEFNATPAPARALFEQALAQPLVRRLSVALCDGPTVAGYLLAGVGKGAGAEQIPEVAFWASRTEHRSGWQAALLLHGFVQRAVAQGVTHARYHCNEGALAPLNVARKTGAVLESLRRGWVLELLHPA